MSNVLLYPPHRRTYVSIFSVLAAWLCMASPAIPASRTRDTPDIKSLVQSLLPKLAKADSRLFERRAGEYAVVQADDGLLRSLIDVTNPRPNISDAALQCAPAKQLLIDDAVQEAGCAVEIASLSKNEDVKKTLSGNCLEYARYAIAKARWECSSYKSACVILRYRGKQADADVVGIVTSYGPGRIDSVLAHPADLFPANRLGMMRAPDGSAANDFLAYTKNAYVQERLRFEEQRRVNDIAKRITDNSMKGLPVNRITGETLMELKGVLNPLPVITEVGGTCAPARQAMIDDKVLELGCSANLPSLMEDEEVKKYLRGECMDYARFAISRKQWECNGIKNAFVLTSMIPGAKTPQVDALVTSNSDSRELKRVLLSYRDYTPRKSLLMLAAPPNSGYRTLCEYLQAYIDRDNSQATVKSVAVFRAKPDYARALLQRLNPEPVMSEAAARCGAATRQEIEDVVSEYGCAADLTAIAENEEIKRKLRGPCMDYAKYAILKKLWSDCFHASEVFIVTTPVSPGTTPSVIGVIASNVTSKNVAEMVNAAMASYTADDLRAMTSAAGASTTSLYDTLMDGLKTSFTGKATNVSKNVKLRELEGIMRKWTKGG